VLPTTYHIPAALVLLAGGLLACFAGYRLFRLVLAIYGFILGALFTVSFLSPATLLATAIAALIGGVIGAVLLTMAYFLGVALLGGGLGVLVAHGIWAQQGWGEPRALLLLAFAIGGAILALIFQRYMIVVGTGLGGAWTAVMGAAAMFGDPTARQITEARNIWIVHPFSPPLDRPWVVGAWLILAIAGIIVQLRAGLRRAK
jgi:hypothetical protein